MTRKDFEMIAETLNRVLNVARDDIAGDETVPGVMMTINMFAARLANDNPRFKIDLFLDAATK
jgi:hypothetical protein